MKRKTILALGLVTATVVGGAFAIPAIAGGWGPGSWGPGGWSQGNCPNGAMRGPGMMFQQGPGTWGQQGPGAWGPGAMRGPGYMMRQGGMPGYGRHARMGQFGMGPMGPANNPVFRSFDTDNDGTVTADEIEKGAAALQKKYDTDGNSSLSLSEFEALHTEMTRGFAKRPFQMLDQNADGQLSPDELQFPARMMARFAPVQIGTPNAPAPATPPTQTPDTK